MDSTAYGLWPIVVINSAVLIIFAASFFRPKTGRDWRAMGAYSAFMVALFTEMYGFPLTIFLISGWLGNVFPELKLTHAGGHIWNDLIGWTGDPHLSPFHLVSYLVIGAGFWLIARAWSILHAAQQKDELATAGPYAWIRHPQYAGFLLIMVGFLLQWPTIPTLVMFPVLVFVYWRLAIGEERGVRQRFGCEWDSYAAQTPRFVPHFGQRTQLRSQ